MDIAVGATIAAVAKKVLSILLGDKKGRKFLLYVVGMVLFIVFLPLIALVGLFGWMSGGADNVMGNVSIMDNSEIQKFNSAFEKMAEHFEKEGLDEADCNKASMIYISYLSSNGDNEELYGDLAYCFLNTTESEGVYDLLEDKFSIVIEEKDRVILDELYGITPVRITNNEESNIAEAPEDTAEAPE